MTRQAEDSAEIVTIPLKAGFTITMRFDEESRGVEICHDEACLVLPRLSAAEFLAVKEFFERVGADLNE